MAEGRDWTRSQFERCPDCGWDPTEKVDHDLGSIVAESCRAWATLLRARPTVDLRVRPDSETWSALEYACHVRDVIAVFRGRIERMREADGVELGWWDHEAAAGAERYNDQDPDAVAAAIVANGEDLAATLDRVGGREWDHRAVRRAGERFTLRGVARFVTHEVTHHHQDALRVLDEVAR